MRVRVDPAGDDVRPGGVEHVGIRRRIDPLVHGGDRLAVDQHVAQRDAVRTDREPTLDQQHRRRPLSSTCISSWQAWTPNGSRARSWTQGILERAVERFRRDRIPLPTFRELADPSTVPAGLLAALDAVGPDEPHPLEPVQGALVQRRRSPEPGPGSPARRAPPGADRGRREDRRRPRRPVPDDRRPQGARGVRVPGAARGDRGVRPHDAAGGVALDGELLPGRRGDLADHGLPGRGRAPRGHERRAVRVARPVGGRSGRRGPDPRDGEQRQGDLRRVRQAGRRRPATRS